MGHFIARTGVGAERASGQHSKLHRRLRRWLGHGLSIAAVLTASLPAFAVLTTSPAAASPPPNISVTFELSGAQGGSSYNAGGLGGGITATTTLAAGSTVSVNVGGQNGYNGGGAAGNYATGSGYHYPGVGGGASDLRIGGSALSDRVLVAGGGGGAGGGWLDPHFGGAGGGGGGSGSGVAGDTGGSNDAGCGGSGGTAIAGGAGGPCQGAALFVNDASPGDVGVGGTGANGYMSSPMGGAGGGGGGGWYGGGGGGGTCCYAAGGGGGGGSGHLDSTTFPGGAVSATDGARSGNGLVRISLDGGTTWVTTFNYTGSAQTYTVPYPPQVTSLSLDHGPTIGGTVVSLFGAHLTDVSGITFCGTAGSGVNVISDTEVQVATPVHAVGSCDLILTTNASGTTTVTNGFRYYATPSVTSSSPSSGPLTGAAVTLTGTNFGPATDVTFGGTSAVSFTVISSTQITATAPAHAAGATTIAVVTADTTGTGPAGFTYVAAPTISSANPSTGPTTGQSVVVTGTNLTGATQVWFGTTPAAGYVVNSATQITATSPVLPVGTVDVSVTTVGGTAIRSNGFRAYATPSVTSINHTSGPAAGGQAVTLTGSGLTGATSVTFGGTSATSLDVVSDSSLTAVTPAGTPGGAAVVVTTPDTTGTGPATYTYVVGPALTGATPTVGPTTGGTAVTVTGSGLTGTTGVTFGSTPASAFVVNSDGEVVATTPPLGPGLFGISLFTAGGTSSLLNAFTAVPSATVTAITPPIGLAQGGDTITITGSGFTATTQVLFGTTPAPSFTVVSDTELRVVTPTGDLGATTVTVTNVLGGHTASAFTFTEATSVVLGASDAAQGGSLPVTGSGFGPNTVVEIWLHSDATLLGRATTDSEGTFSAVVTLPASVSGDHTVEARGVDASGAAVSVSASLHISPTAAAAATPAAAPTSTPSEPPTELAFTGGDASTPLLVAIVFMAVGGVTLRLRRRTRRTA